MHTNSIDAYHAVSNILRPRERKVLDWLDQHGPATDRQIVTGLGFTDMNAIRPRVTELIGRGLVREVGNRRDEVTGVTVRIVDVERTAPQQMEFAA